MYLIILIKVFERNILHFKKKINEIVIASSWQNKQWIWKYLVKFNVIDPKLAILDAQWAQSQNNWVLKDIYAF